MSEARSADAASPSPEHSPALTATRLSSVVSGSAVYLLSNVLLAAIPFALLPVLTRYLSPEQYGQVAMFQTLLGALGAFVGVGIPAAVARKHFDDLTTPESMREFNGASLQVLSGSALVVLFVVIAVQDILARALGIPAAWVVSAVLVTAAGVLVQIRLAEWQVRQRAFSYGRFQVGQSLLNMLLSLVLVVPLSLGAAGRIGAQSVAVVLFAVVAALLLWRDGLLRVGAWRPAMVKEIVSYGVPLIPHVLAAFILFSVDRLVINSELGLADAGIYMVAAQLAGAVSLIFDAINRAYMPWLFDVLKRGDEREKRHVVLTTYRWFGVILAAAGFVFLLGPWAVAVVAGERFAKAGSVIGWLVLGQAFLGMYLLLGSYLMYGKRTGLLSFATVLSAAIYIVLLLVLVPAFGLKGAAVGFATAMGLRLALTWWGAHRSHPMPWLTFLSHH